MRRFHSPATRPAPRILRFFRSRTVVRRRPGLVVQLAGVFFLALLFANMPMTAELSAQTPAHPHRRTLTRTNRASARHKTGYRPRHAEPEPRQVSSLPAIPLLPLEHYGHLPPLRGSHESLVRQNQRDEQEGLERIADDAALSAMLNNGQLVALPVTQGMRVDERLAENRRYCLPWVANFLADLARAHFARFHSALQVNSAVRTVAYQEHLLRINGNAAPAEGDVASPHLTGAAIDIAKKGLSPSEVGWMRAYLLPLEVAGKIDVEEEFEQACFHITVYKDYAPLYAPRVETATARPPRRPRHRRGSVLLATRMR